ncbi:MAG: HEAT repeat protein [Chlamydiales bacterium]|jgi:HEAT repeat protein
MHSGSQQQHAGFQAHERWGHGHRWHPSTGIAALALVLSMVASSARAQVPAQAEHGSARELDEARGVEDVGQVMLDCRALEGGAFQLTERLSALGTDALGRMFATLARGRFEVRVGERGHSVRPITAGERLGLITSLGRMPWIDLQVLLDERQALDPDEGERVAALQLIGAFGDASMIQSLVLWAQPGDPHARAPRAVKSALTDNVALLTSHHPRAMRALPGLYAESNLSLVAPLLQALRDSASATTVEVMIDMLGRIPAADPLVLAELAQVAPLARRPVKSRLRLRVRAYLSFPHDRTSMLEAIVACRNLGDVDAIPALIEFLESEDPVLRERAHETLKELTGQHHPPLAKRWSDWHASSMRWWKNEARAELNTVRNGNPADATRAVLELSKRDLFRHRLSEELAPALARTERELVVLTIASIGHLGSPLSVPALLETLSRPDVDIRRAAFLALRRITGEDHGEDPHAWHDAGW